MFGQQDRGHAEMRRAAQDRAEVVRIADAIEPQRALPAGRKIAQPARQRLRFLAQDVGHHALVMRAACQLVQVARLDHAIADAIGHAPLQQGLQLRDARFGEVQLADRLRPPGEHRLHRVEAVQAQLGITAFVLRIGMRLGLRLGLLAPRSCRRHGTALSRLPGRTRITHGHLPPAYWLPVYPVAAPALPASACTSPAARRTPAPRTARTRWRTPRRR